MMLILRWQTAYDLIYVSKLQSINMNSFKTHISTEMLTNTMTDIFIVSISECRSANDMITFVSNLCEKQNSILFKFIKDINRIKGR